MRLLVTGFGPYPGVAHNPTALLARRIAAHPRLRRFSVEASAHVFEVSYATVARDLPRLLADLRPDAVLHLGLAPRERMIRIELRGENRRRMLHPDRSGAAPVRRRLEEAGPDLRSSRAPAEPLLRLFERARLPVRLSRDAGAYLCNATLYASLGATGTLRPPPPTVFIHLPRPHRLGRKGPPSRAVETRASDRMTEALVTAALLLVKDARRRSA